MASTSAELQYLEKSGLKGVLTEITSQILMSKPDDPWTFMKMMLDKLIANEELAKQKGDLKLNGNGSAAQFRRNSMSTFMNPTGKITILHFNDVYNIEARKREPCGGASRFVTKLRSFMAEKPLVLFSGDCFNPSIMSTVTKGAQMVPVLNEMNIEVAVYGNHDFDFGVPNLEKLANQCNFPWLISNVIDKATMKPLASGMTEHIVVWQGIRIGVIGLIEKEWLATLATIDEDQVIYEDFVTTGRRMADALRRNKGAQFVVALTHMRQPNDERLGREAPEIDLILGGHDHHYSIDEDPTHGTHVVKSGTDFRDLTAVRVNFDKAGPKKPFSVTTERFAITSDIMPDPKVELIVKQYEKIVGSKMQKVIGYNAEPLDSRFKIIRTQESNVGNLVADIMKWGIDADLAILNSGTLRADELTPPGKILMSYLVSVLPMVDDLCMIQMTGAQVLEALENGVCQYPRLEGRFPAISGVRFRFDGKKPAGKRLEEGKTTICGKPLSLTAKYKVVTKAYLADGKDGYTVFKDCPVLADSEACAVLPTLVRNFFNDVSILNGFASEHHMDEDKLKELAASENVKLTTLEGGEKMYSISPKCDGRITNTSA